MLIRESELSKITWICIMKRIKGCFRVLSEFGLWNMGVLNSFSNGRQLPWPHYSNSYKTHCLLESSGLNTQQVFWKPNCLSEQWWEERAICFIQSDSQLKVILLTKVYIINKTSFGKTSLTSYWRNENFKQAEESYSNLSLMPCALIDRRHFPPVLPRRGLDQLSLSLVTCSPSLFTPTLNSNYTADQSWKTTA